MRDWPELKTRFELNIAFEDVRPADADLDAFEARFGLRLPDDYRTFAKELGAGELDFDRCEIYAPGGPPGDHFGADIAQYNVRMRELLGNDLMRPKVGRDVAWLGDLVYFCNIGEGYCICAWQTREVTDPGTGDMAIYAFQEGGREDRMERVAETFREFVTDFLVGNGYFRDFLPAKPAEDHPDPNRVVTYCQYAYIIPGDD